MCAVLRVLVLLVAAALTRGQDVTGSVVGFDGEALRWATVVVHGEAGGVVLQTLTDESGRFTIAGSLRAHSVQVAYEAVLSPPQIVDADRSSLAFRLGDVPHWLLRGSVQDPGGRPARHVDVAVRDARGRALATVTIDDAGRFVLRCSVPLAAVVVDPLGWNHVIEGPFRAARELAIDMRSVRDDYVRHVGRVLDLDGRPAAEVTVVAQSTRDRRPGRGQRIGSARTDPDGKFVAWTRGDVSGWAANVDGARLYQPVGVWRVGTPAELDARLDALVFVSGEVLDRYGEPVADVEVFASRDGALAGRSYLVARSDTNGRFVTMVPAATRSLIAQLGGEPFADVDAPFEGGRAVLRER